MDYHSEEDGTILAVGGWTTVNTYSDGIFRSNPNPVNLVYVDIGSRTNYELLNFRIIITVMILTSPTGMAEILVWLRVVLL